MIDLFAGLISLAAAGLQIVPITGTPVDIAASGSDFIISCTEPAGVYLCSSGGVMTELSGRFCDPRNVCVWNGIPAVSDFSQGTVTAGDIICRLPGSPEGICPVNWYGDSVSFLAVCLFNRGTVALMDMNGDWCDLATVEGAKSVAACDADLDGDEDLFVSGCGTGVVVVENRGTDPVVHHIGNIGSGVKRIAASDMDFDGFMDVAGVACAEGGAGWWRNPGSLQEPWQFIPIDTTLQGPKDLSVKGDSMMIASLFSPLFTSFTGERSFPSGFTSCCISETGRIAAGSMNGFLVLGDPGSLISR